MSPLVSVIIPSYNHGAFLTDCIESVLSQDYSNFEVIIVDDGSLDNSLQIAHKLRRKSKNSFKVIAQHNVGAHESINRGVRASSGLYCNVINSDDLFDYRRLAACAKAAISSKCEMVFTGVDFIDELGNQIVSDSYVEDIKRKQQSIDVDLTIGFALLRSNVAVSTGNMFFSRALFDRLGGFDDLKYVHDWDFMLRSILITEPLFLEFPFYKYRLHGNNSFKSLANVAGYECTLIMKRFFRHAKLGVGNNHLAPTLKNWGPLWMEFISEVHYQQYLGI